LVKENRKSSRKNSVQETAAREEFVVAADPRIDYTWKGPRLVIADVPIQRLLT
jgi:hypothetical protein